MFKTLRPLVKIAVELRRIANALEYFAVADARTNRRFYTVGGAKHTEKDESELLHTDEVKIRAALAEKYQQWLQGGANLVEKVETDE